MKTKKPPTKSTPEEIAAGEPRYPRIKVRLSGRDGNAFFIIGSVQRALREAGVPEEELAEFRKQAMSGDYANVISTCGDWVQIS